MVQPTLGMRRYAALIALFAASAARGEVRPLELGAAGDGAPLLELLWERSPKLEGARAQARAAEAEVERARLLPNPGVDLSWNTIPVGPTNPPGLADPLLNVPNYAATVSLLLELAKRGPRLTAAEERAAAALEDVRDALQQDYFELLAHAGEIAAAQLRIASLQDLAQDAARLTELQRARTRAGDASGLDADRASLEEEKLVGSLGQERARLQGELRACAEVAGVPCVPFAGAPEAEAFLGRDAAGGAAAPLEERPDLRSLEHQRAAAAAALQLAHRRAIPDVTLRAGYTYDQFAVSGNQGQSVLLGASLPIPVFDHGQADAAAASAAASAAERSRALLLDRARAQLEALKEEERAAGARRDRVRDAALPLARRLVGQLEAATGRGGAGLQDLLLARRSLGELAQQQADLELEVFQLRLQRARVLGAAPRVEGRGS